MNPYHSPHPVAKSKPFYFSLYTKVRQAYKAILTFNSRKGNACKQFTGFYLFSVWWHFMILFLLGNDYSSPEKCLHNSVFSGSRPLFTVSSSEKMHVLSINIKHILSAWLIQKKSAEINNDCISIWRIKPSCKIQKGATKKHSRKAQRNQNL